MGLSKKNDGLKPNFIHRELETHLYLTHFLTISNKDSGVKFLQRFKEETRLRFRIEHW